MDILFFIGFVAIVIGEISVRYASPDLESNLKFFINKITKPHPNKNNIKGILFPDRIIAVEVIKNNNVNL